MSGETTLIPTVPFKFQYKTVKALTNCCILLARTLNDNILTLQQIDLLIQPITTRLLYTELSGELD